MAIFNAFPDVDNRADPSEVPVRMFPVFDFENMDDQNFVMNRQKDPDIPLCPKRVYRMAGFGCLNFLDGVVWVFP
jgi:hypothetical protein